jgi:3-dehydroquinate synthase
VRIVGSAGDRLSVTVDLGPRSYEILITSGSLGSAAHEIARWHGGRKALPGKVLFVVDANAAHPHGQAVEQSLAAAGWLCATVRIDPGEQSKSLAVAARIYDSLVEMQADRETVVVAVGGGVVGDTAGFAAATFARGIPFVQIPTTLLAQVDSSVGGKVGVNHPHGKNLIGAFHQPLGVLIDTRTLETLPERDYRSGLAEVVKYGVILNGAFFEFLEANVEPIVRRDPLVLRQIIARSCRLKADIVEQDEQERTGLRAVLNYGHTFAHALEALAGYGAILHGEAVAIGMVCASRLAERRKLIDARVTARQAALLTALGLPTRWAGSTALSADDVLDRMRLDKKTAAGKLRFVLPTRLGHVELFADVPDADVKAVVQDSL